MRTTLLSLKLLLAGVITTACIPVVWFTCSAFEPELIVWQAERVAGNRPYCIAVSDAKVELTYNEVKNMSELTFRNLTTRLDWGGSDGPLTETYYALLVIKDPDDVRNWSKSWLEFRDDVNTWQWSIYKQDWTKFCNPKVGFVKGL